MSADNANAQPDIGQRLKAKRRGGTSFFVLIPTLVIGLLFGKWTK